MTPATHRDISKLIDNFIRDVVASRNLPAGWALAGPDLRGGTTRAAWDRGKGVTVQRFSHVLGTYFGNAWDLEKLDSPGHAELTVNVRIGGKYPQVVAEPTVVEKVHGRWVVDTMYTAGIFRSTGRGSCAKASCRVTGVNDFGVAAGSSSREIGITSPERAQWMWVVLGSVGGLLLLTLGSLLFYTRIRDRRAMRAFEARTGGH